jgi:hypothetical protein
VDTPTAPDEKDYSQLGFELLHGLRKGWLRDVDRVGRCGEPPMVDDGQKMPESVGVHK